LNDVQIAAKLSDVPGDWDSLVGTDGFYLSRGWLSFVESVSPVSPWYLFSAGSGVLRGALVLNRMNEGLTFRYRPQHFRDLLGIDGTFLMAGASRGYHSTLLRPDGASGGDTLARLMHEAGEIASAEGCSGVVLPFLPTQALLEIASQLPVRASFDVMEAEISGIGDGVDAYCHHAGKKVRGNMKRDRASFARAGWQFRTRRLDECWREAAQLLANLEAKYGRSSRDIAALERALAGQAKLLASQNVVFTCEDDQGMAGMAIIYRWRSALYVRAAGFDYQRLRNGCEYFNLAIWEPIEYSEGTGVDRLHMGIGSWEAKGYRGAVLLPLWSAVVLPGAQPGLDLTGTEEAHRVAGDFSSRGLTVDTAQLRAVEEFAASHTMPAASRV
jgi:uncharacterized protein